MTEKGKKKLKISLIIVLVLVVLGGGFLSGYLVRYFVFEKHAMDVAGKCYEIDKVEAVIWQEDVTNEQKSEFYEKLPSKYEKTEGGFKKYVLEVEYADFIDLSFIEDGTYALRKKGRTDEGDWTRLGMDKSKIVLWKESGSKTSVVYRLETFNGKLCIVGISNDNREPSVYVSLKEVKVDLNASGRAVALAA